MNDHVTAAAAIAVKLEALWAEAEAHRELALLAYLIDCALVEASERATSNG